MNYHDISIAVVIYLCGFRWFGNELITGRHFLCQGSEGCDAKESSRGEPGTPVEFYGNFTYLLPTFCPSPSTRIVRIHVHIHMYVIIYIWDIYDIYISTHILNLCTCTCVHIACKYIIFSTVQPPTGYAYPYVYVDTYIFQQYIEWAFDFKYLHKGSFFATPSEQIHWMGY